MIYKYAGYKLAKSASVKIGSRLFLRPIVSYFPNPNDFNPLYFYDWTPPGFYSYPIGQIVFYGYFLSLPYIYQWVMHSPYPILSVDSSVIDLSLVRKSSEDYR